MAQKTLYILYDVDASLKGKLQYNYRKLRSSKSAQPACAAAAVITVLPICKVHVHEIISSAIFGCS